MLRVRLTDGGLVRAIQFGTTERNNHAWNMTADNAGNIYVNGITSGVLQPGFDMGTAEDTVWVGKFSASLDTVWLKQFGTALFTESYGISFTPDGSGVPGQGYLYLSGWTLGQYDSQDTGFYSNWVARYDPSTGSQLWIHQHGTPRYEWTWTNTADSAGNVYVAGLTYGDIATDGTTNAGFADAYVASYAPTGTLRFIRQYGSADGSEVPLDIRRGSDGRIYMTGQTTGSWGAANRGFGDSFVAALGTDGRIQQLRQFGGRGDDRFWRVNESGSNLFLVGMSDDSLVRPSAGSLDWTVFKLARTTLQ